jgi:ribulose-phosphate 3-epimerase
VVLSHDVPRRVRSARVRGRKIGFVGWSDWIRDRVEVEPSLYAADFTRLGAQIEALLGGGCRIFHFDIGDGHFVPPVTIGPVVLRSIAPMIHAAGAVVDCHLMVTDPEHHFEEIAQSGGDGITFHVEVTDDPAGVAAAARAFGLAVGVSFNPGTGPETAAAFAAEAGAEIVLCMSINPGYSGQAFMPEAFDRVARIAELVDVPIQVDGGIGAANARAVRAAGASLLVAGSAVFADPDPAAAYRRIAAAASIA